MANDVNKNVYSNNPGDKITIDINPASTGDNISLFNHPNPTTTEKFQFQKQQQQRQQKNKNKNKNKNQRDKKHQHHHEVTHQMTVYNTKTESETTYNMQTEHPQISTDDQQKQKYKQNYEATHQASQPTKYEAKNTPTTHKEKYL